MFDSPCKSPDCPADCDLISWEVNGSVFKVELFRGARFLDKRPGFAPAAFFGRLADREAAFFKSTLLAVLFLEVVFFAAGFFPTAFRAGFPFFAALRCR